MQQLAGGRLGQQPQVRCCAHRARSLLGRRRTVAAHSSSPDGGSSGAQDGDDKSTTARSRLEATIKRKSVQVESTLKELGLEALEERLQSAVRMPAAPAHRVATLIADATTQGRCVLVFELVRPSPAATSAEMQQLAKRFVALGADALAIPMDAEDTPSGAVDLWTVCQAVKVPVMAKDWIIHPLQVVEVKQAGAAGVIGVIHQVNGRGTPVMSSFAAAVGLDAPVEVVNAMEVENLSRAGVVFYGINLSVGLSLPIPGFSSDIAHGILGRLPFGAISMVGVRSLEEARKARASGADSLLIKRELIQQFLEEEEAAKAAGGLPDPFKAVGLRRLAEELRYLTSADD